jgi:hypothetical protein
VPPLLPPEVDERADWVVRIESIESVVAGQFYHAAAQHLDGRQAGALVRFLRHREPLGAAQPHGAARYHWLCAALQLVDRRGAATEGDLAHLAAACSGCATPSWRSRRCRPAPRRWPAAELDRLCAGVDIQIGVNVLARDQAFSGAKLSGLLTPPGSSCWRRLLPFPRRQGPDRVRAVQPGAGAVLGRRMRGLTTQGVTLTLDVPRWPTACRSSSA